jgi:hypothetical protein
MFADSILSLDGVQIASVIQSKAQFSPGITPKTAMKNTDNRAFPVLVFATPGVIPGEKSLAGSQEVGGENCSF